MGKMLDARVIQDREYRAKKDTVTEMVKETGKHKLAAGLAAFGGAATTAALAAPAMAAPAVAAGNKQTDLWGNLGKGIVSVLNGIRPFVIAITIAALVICGIGVIIGSEQRRQQFKTAIIWIIIGAAVVLLAGPISARIVEATDANGNGGNGYDTYLTMIKFATMGH